MKRISLFAAVAAGALVLLGNTAVAQDAPKKGKAGPAVEQQVERMTKQLELTDAQKPKVKAVLEETRKKRQDLMDDTSVSGRDRRTKMTALTEEQDKKLKAILTPDQYSKMEKQREEARAKAKDKAPGERKGKKRAGA